jgi:hypothetical protein
MDWLAVAAVDAASVYRSQIVNAVRRLDRHCRRIGRVVDNQGEFFPQAGRGLVGVDRAGGIVGASNPAFVDRSQIVNAARRLQGEHHAWADRGRAWLQNKLEGFPDADLSGVGVQRYISIIRAAKATTIDRGQHMLSVRTVNVPYVGRRHDTSNLVGMSRSSVHAPPDPGVLFHVGALVRLVYPSFDGGWNMRGVLEFSPIDTTV